MAFLGSWHLVLGHLFTWLFKIIAILLSCPVKLHHSEVCIHNHSLLVPAPPTPRKTKTKQEMETSNSCVQKFLFNSQ